MITVSRYLLHDENDQPTGEQFVCLTVEAEEGDCLMTLLEPAQARTLAASLCNLANKIDMRGLN